MEFFRIATAYDQNGNSPWDALWYDGDDDDLNALRGQMRLAAIWKAPRLRLETRYDRPDVYVFQIFYALSKKFRDLLVPLLGDCAEFLPLQLLGGQELFVL